MAGEERIKKCARGAGARGKNTHAQLARLGFALEELEIIPLLPPSA